jgi:hypothetical protein
VSKPIGDEPNLPVLTRYFGQMAEDLFRGRPRMKHAMVTRAAILRGEGGFRVLTRSRETSELAVYSFGDGVLHLTGETWEDLPIYCEQERPRQGWSYIADLRQRDREG